MKIKSRVKRLPLLLTIFLSWGLLACNMVSISIDAQVSFEGDGIHIDAQLGQVDTGSIIESLDLGNTVRVTWIVYLPGFESRFTRYARKDTVGGGYHLFDSVTSTDITVFNDDAALLENLLFLRDYKIYLVNEWKEKDSLSIRAYVDKDLKNPPLSVISIFSRSASSKMKIVSRKQP